MNTIKGINQKYYGGKMRELKLNVEYQARAWFSLAAF